MTKVRQLSNMKYIALSLLILTIWASAAQAACYADYKAKQDNPLRLHYGVSDMAKGCGLVIGLGGGSSLDVAKLAALLAGNGRTLADTYAANTATGPRLPLIAIPTMAGTGSEVTPIAIFTTGAREKMGVVSPLIIPDIAILDPELTYDLPAHVTAEIGIDAMVHAIESYASTNPNNNPISRAFANSHVAAVHALAYPIGGHFKVPHVLSNALVLTHVLRFNAQKYPDSYAALAPHAFPGVPATATGLIDGLVILSKSCGLTQTLRDVGIKKIDLPCLATNAMKQTRLLMNNPRTVTYDDALAIYQAAL